MNIQNILTSKLNMSTYNPRKNLTPDDPEYQKLKKSIEQYGYIDPIIWNEQTGNVVGGHQRLKILISENHSEVAVSVVSLSINEEKALNLTLNKVSGDWNEEMLSSLLLELNDESFFTGFDVIEIEHLTADLIDVTSNQLFSNVEIDTKEFNNEHFEYVCPRCSFKFNE